MRRKSEFTKKYFVLTLKVILKVESIKFLKLTAFRVDVSICLARNATIFSFPLLTLLTPHTYPRKRVHRPTCLPIIHDSKLGPIPFLASCREVKPISVPCGIDIIMQHETVRVSDSGGKGEITTLKSGIKL